MEYNLIIETEHFLPPAGRLCLLVSDKNFSNLWVMVSWQTCCMRPNMMAGTRQCDVDPMVLHSFPQPPPPSSAACNVKSLSIWWWREQLGGRMCEDYLCYWLTPAKSPHPVLKGTNPCLPHDLLLYAFL